MAPNLMLCASLRLISSSATIALSFKQTLLRWYDASRITLGEPKATRMTFQRFPGFYVLDYKSNIRDWLYSSISKSLYPVQCCPKYTPIHYNCSYTPILKYFYDSNLFFMANAVAIRPVFKWSIWQKKYISLQRG